MVFQLKRMIFCFYCIQLLTSRQCCLGLERYVISDTKTKVFIANSPIDTNTWIFSINGKAIEVVEVCTHLGIERNPLSKSGHLRLPGTP